MSNTNRARIIALWTIGVLFAAGGFGVQYALMGTMNDGTSSIPYSRFNALHLQIGYIDQGFVKRGAVGTFFQLLPNPWRNVAQLAFGALLIAACAAGVARALSAARRRLAEDQWRLLALLWLGLPLTFWNIGYDFARLDQLNLLLLAASLRLVDRRMPWAVASLTGIALLIHEAYLFYGVPLVASALATYDPHRDSSDVPRAGHVKNGLPMIAVASVTLLALALWGRYEPGRAALVASLGERLHDAHHNGLQVWLRPVAANLDYVIARWTQTLFDPIDLIVYAAITAMLTCATVAVARANRTWPRLMAAAPLGLLPLFILGIDYARWFALAGVVILITVTHGVLAGTITRVAPHRRMWVTMILAGSAALLGPIGTVHVLPLLQAIATRVAHVN